MTDNPYDRVTFRGFTFDRWTVQGILAVEADLGYELTLDQGSYRPSASRWSANTHRGGGVFDLVPADAKRKIAALQRHGFVPFHRMPIPGLWVEHIHVVQRGNVKADPSAIAQIDDYDRKRNALAGQSEGPYWPMDEWRPVSVHPYVKEADMPLNADDLKKIEAIVAKYVGDVVPYPTAADPKNTVWVSTILNRIAKKIGA
jgi:hypothetical protein